MSAEDVSLAIEIAEDSMKKAINHLEAELTKIRAGKANPQMLDEPAMGGGARALATMVFAAPGAALALDVARRALELSGDSRGGVTTVNGLLVARFLGPDPAAVRRSLARSAAAWRGVLMERSPRLPRLWSI